MATKIFLKCYCRQLKLSSNIFRYSIALTSTEAIRIPLFENEKYMKIAQDTRPDIFNKAKTLMTDLKDLHDLKLDPKSDTDLKKSIEEEESHLKAELESLHESLVDNVCLDEDSQISTVIMEINGAVGGEEAKLFAAELCHLYETFVISKGWTFSEINRSGSDMGGVQKVSVQIEGSKCYQFLRHEAGVHRVQRVPKTEKTGRMHTSTATVHVLPIRKSQVEIEIPPKDLKITSMRATGPGGQHVNKTETRCAITHIPTGITVECQETRYGDENKKRALQKVKQLLWLREKDKIMQEYQNTKKSQVSSADRSEKLRTYNFQQDRITDHRLSDNIYDIKGFMSGNSDRLQQLLDRLESNHKQNVLIQLFNSS